MNKFKVGDIVKTNNSDSTVIGVVKSVDDNLVEVTGFRLDNVNIYTGAHSLDSVDEYSFLKKWLNEIRDDIIRRDHDGT